jgi:mRNA interferase MazF
MVVRQGDVFWADMPPPSGSEPGDRHPVVVVQSDAFNQTSIDTIVVVPLTSNLSRAADPGNVELPAGSTGLPKDSVANVSQIITIDREFLTGRTGRISASELQSILDGIELIIGRRSERTTTAGL